MMKLPNLDSLRFFAVAARHLNFTRAGREMGISQSAMSQQIGRLEEAVGFRLFNRQARGLTLTAKGERLLGAVRDGLGRIQHTLQELDDTSPREIMTVRTLPSIASRWLMPRVKKFREFAPELSFRVEAEIALPDFLNDGVDVAIIYGKTDHPEWDQTFMFNDAIIPVCAPSFLEEHPIETPADLDGQYLMHDSIPHGIYSTNWDDWFARLGMSPPRYGRGLSFSTAYLVSQSAVTGQGVALTRFSLVADELEDGSLVRLFDHVIYEDGFYVACPKSSLKRIAIQRFYEWILQESAVFKERMRF
jgi:LysR family glycine cleavage system transcriptional activator